MGYPIGEIIMVNFVILNSDSLHFNNRESFKNCFKEILDIVRFLKDEKQYYDSIRTSVDVSKLEFLKGEYLQKFISNERDPDLKKRIISFFSNTVEFYSVYTFSEESELGLLNYEFNKKDLELSEYEFNEKSNLDMGYADIFNTLLISFNSSKIWDSHVLNLKKIQLTNECSVEESIVDLLHASKMCHLNSHLKFFENLEHKILLNIQDKFKQGEKNFFKKIQFCKEIDECIYNIDRRILNDSIKILYYLEITKRNLNDYSYSDESDGVKNNPRLRNMRRFTLPNNEQIYMFKHIKNLPNGYRIYFHLDNDSIFIGYIGKHLPTINH